MSWIRDVSSTQKSIVRSIEEKKSVFMKLSLFLQIAKSLFNPSECFLRRGSEQSTLRFDRGLGIIRHGKKIATIV